MAVRNWIVDGWKAVSLRNGFEEYDGPIFEYLKMFQIKSGDEIAEQLFSLTDRGGRELAIRPEITPTLARMVNQQINSLPRPIKWFSVPRLCRAERPQKGRLREFFQWNIDIIGVDDVLADAEVIFTTVDYLRSIGLKPEDIQVRISSRKLLATFLSDIGIAEKQLDSLYALLDKYKKIPSDTFEKILLEQVSDSATVKKILDFMAVDSLEQMDEIVNVGNDVRDPVIDLKVLFSYLDVMEIREYCVFDPSIVRGLAYYTGVVFEIYDRASELRAIGGGGRYDDLLKQFGGPQITGTGMGMGDCVLEILLEEKGLLDKQLPKRQLDYFVAFAEKSGGGTIFNIVAKLRSKGYKADFSYKYKAGNLAKQLKEASNRNAKNCIIIGEEFMGKNNELVIKDMDSGEQELVEVAKFFAQL